ncbi:HNH endonuclease [Sporosarcina globispora]|nr:HNH endonuclease [Sporosarcina globispora]
MKLCSDCKLEKSVDDFYSQEKYSKRKGKYIYYQPYCKNCATLRVLKWEDNNRERKNARMKKWSSKPENIPTLRRNQKNYRMRGKQLEWQRNNKDKLREYNKKREEKIHKITDQEWNACKNYFNNECAYCGMTYTEHKNQHNQDLHREHVEPEGKDDLSNCIPSCKNCNSSKGTKLINEWYNISNKKFSVERLTAINKWLNEDYKKYMENNACFLI